MDNPICRDGSKKNLQVPTHNGTSSTVFRLGCMRGTYQPKSQHKLRRRPAALYDHRQSRLKLNSHHSSIDRFRGRCLQGRAADPNCISRGRARRTETLKRPSDRLGRGLSRGLSRRGRGGRRRSHRPSASRGTRDGFALTLFRQRTKGPPARRIFSMAPSATGLP
jgi:hypothetical protein